MTTPAYERNGAPCTRAEFYAIACDPARSVAVEACAGAGKTWMLVSRIVRALLAGTQPDEILAITFTRKAAGEMRERLQAWLLEFSRPGIDETTAQWMARLQHELEARGVEAPDATRLREPLSGLYRALLEGGCQVQIRTFHSWFIALLGSAPLAVLQELGLPLEYELLEDDKAAVTEVWRPFLRAVARDSGLREDYVDLVQALGRTRAHEALEGALQRRIEFAMADRADCVGGAVARFEAACPVMAGVACPTDWLLCRSEGRALLQRAADALSGLAAPSFAKKGAELTVALKGDDWRGVAEALFTDHGQGNARAFGKSRPEAVTAAQDAVETVRAACAQHEAWLHQQRMTRLTRQLIASFAALKRQRGWVDMDDVERAALALLADHQVSAWVQERLDLRIRQLLVDEFQDTNALQWQALHAWLAGYAGTGGGAEAPRVFIVGDPKQSIYRFRRADPKLFAAAQHFMVQALGGERLACDHTRRNARGVLDVVNAVMQSAQAAGEFDGFRAHTTESVEAGEVGALPLIPRREVAGGSAGKDAPLTWRDSLTQPREEPEETLRTLECRQVARWITGRIAAGVAPEELLVLARRREPLAVLKAELRACGVAAEYADEQLLIEQPAALDVLALVDALVSPGNDLALARALKSPLFGLGDEDLVALALAAQDAGGDKRTAWLDALPGARLSGADAPVLHADLMRFRGYLLTLPPHDALQAIYAETDACARFAAAAPAAERDHVVRQLQALQAAALDVDGGRFLGAYRWLRALRRQKIAAPQHAVAGSVRLLTVHGAKGLEAAEVVLLDAAVKSGARPGRAALLVDWPDEQAAPRLLVFLARDNAAPQDAEVLLREEQAAQAREELNALYVAMTRARRRLVLAGFEPHHSPGDSWWLRIREHGEQVRDLDEPPDALVDAGAATTVHLRELPPSTRVDARRDPTPPIAAADVGDDQSRVGQAMHWLLERVHAAGSDWPGDLVARAQRLFDLDAAQAARAAGLAQRIRTGEAAWVWSTAAVVEAYDEVELTHAGERLRIDRLVRRRASDTEPEAWWIIDYKSAHRPENDAGLMVQLERYRVALGRIYPGAGVRAAFIAGDGRMVEVSMNRAG